MSGETIAVVDVLTTRWWEHHRCANGARAERKALSCGAPAEIQAAYDEVERPVEGGGAPAVEVVAALAEPAPTIEDTAFVGASPLEDLLVEHGEEIVDLIVTEARRSARFAAALSAVWINESDVSDSTRARLAPWV